MLRGTTDPARQFSAVISTPRVDRYGDVIKMSGWQLNAFRSNPIIQLNHRSDILPIGRASKVWRDGDKLRSTFELSTDAEAERVRKLINDNFMFAVSVGFIPIDWTFSMDPNRLGGIDFHKAELVEFSVVNTPANPDAL